MKKTFLILLLAIAISGCQQKEEPKSQYQFPTGPVQVAPVQIQDDVKILQEAVKKDPHNVNAWIKMGNILMDASRFNEAIEAYKKALDIDPKNIDVRVDMGTCYRYSGRPDLAVQEYRKGLEINPRHQNSRKNLAIVLAYDMNDRKQAIKEFEKYLELFPNAPEAERVKQEIQKLKTS
ncbi:MAG: tetratricopeptide repeat protein [Nitrospirae bacterium]|nr:tetratricopeptide repeat protein [Nitrospirota bacterium]